MARATWQGAVLTEGNDVVFVEGNCYFRREDVHWEHLKPSRHTTICGWKGTANYYDVMVDGKRNQNAAWYYAAPQPAAAEIQNRIAFWKGVHVDAAPANAASLAPELPLTAVPD